MPFGLDEMYQTLPKSVFSCFTEIFILFIIIIKTSFLIAHIMIHSDCSSESNIATPEPSTISSINL